MDSVDQLQMKYHVLAERYRKPLDLDPHMDSIKPIVIVPLNSVPLDGINNGEVLSEQECAMPIQQEWSSSFLNADLKLETTELKTEETPDLPEIREIQCSDATRWEIPFNESVIELNRVKCGICNRVYINWTHLDNHQAKDHPEFIIKDLAVNKLYANYACTYCQPPVQFSNKVALQNHVFAIHAAKRTVCTQCNIDFKTRCEISKHLQEVHIEMPTLTNGRKSTSKKKASRHMKNEGSSTLEKSTKRTKARNSTSENLSNTDNDEGNTTLPNQADIDDDRNHGAYLTIANQEATDNDIFPWFRFGIQKYSKYYTKGHLWDCSLCMRVFHTRRSLKTHITTVHLAMTKDEVSSPRDKEPYGCMCCVPPKYLKKEENFLEHLQTHAKYYYNYNGKCMRCDVPFSSQEEMYKHVLDEHVTFRGRYKKDIQNMTGHKPKKLPQKRKHSDNTQRQTDEEQATLNKNINDTIRRCASDGLWYCNECGSKGKRHCDVVRHQERIHKFSFPTIDKNIADTIGKCINGDIWYCKECNLKSTRICDLVRHQNRVHKFRFPPSEKRKASEFENKNATVHKNMSDTLSNDANTETTIQPDEEQATVNKNMNDTICKCASDGFWYCNECGFKGKRNCDVVRHQERIHKFSFPTINKDVNDTIRKCTSGNFWYCNECNLKYIKISNVIRHQEMVHKFRFPSGKKWKGSEYDNKNATVHNILNKNATVYKNMSKNAPVHKNMNDTLSNDVRTGTWKCNVCGFVSLQKAKAIHHQERAHKFCFLPLEKWKLERVTSGNNLLKYRLSTGTECRTVRKNIKDTITLCQGADGTEYWMCKECDFHSEEKRELIQHQERIHKFCFLPPEMWKTRTPIDAGPNIVVHYGDLPLDTTSNTDVLPDHKEPDVNLNVLDNNFVEKDVDQDVKKADPCVMEIVPDEQDGFDDFLSDTKTEVQDMHISGEATVTSVSQSDISLSLSAVIERKSPLNLNGFPTKFKEENMVDMNNVHRMQERFHRKSEPETINLETVNEGELETETPNCIDNVEGNNNWNLQVQGVTQTALDKLVHTTLEQEMKSETSGKNEEENTSIFTNVKKCVNTGVNESVNQSVNRHDSECKFQCRLCSAGFNLKESIALHMKTHTEDPM